MSKLFSHTYTFLVFLNEKFFEVSFFFVLVKIFCCQESLILWFSFLKRLGGAFNNYVDKKGEEGGSVESPQGVAWQRVDLYHKSRCLCVTTQMYKCYLVLQFWSYGIANVWLPDDLAEVIKLIRERFETSPKKILYVILSELVSFLPYYCHSFHISVIPSEYCHSFQIIAISNICHPE